MGGEAKPIWEIYPKLFAAPPYGNEWIDDPNEKDSEEIAEAEPPVEGPENNLSQLTAVGLNINRVPPTVQ